MSNPIENSDAAYSQEQADLFRKWIDHFGAVDAKELDLGTLMAIHELVLGGLAPSAPGRERSSASVG